MPAAVLIVLLAGAVDRAEISRLPELGRIEAAGPTVLVLRGQLPSARRAAAIDRARAVAADVGRRFLTAASPKRAVDVCLFETPEGYRAFADRVMGERPSELGWYSPSDRVVVVNLRAGLRNMSHELVHPLVGDDFPSIPSWLNEGLGALYGGSDVTPRGVRFFVNYRHRDVRAALREGTLPAAETMATAGPEQVYGERAMLWYGYARGALLFFESRGELERFYRDLRAGLDAAQLLRARAPEDRLRQFFERAVEGRRVEPPRR